MYGGDSSLFTWDEFLRGAAYCTSEQGSALFDATLGDEELIEDMFREAIAKQSSKLKDPKDNEPYYPARRGYTREVEATLDVADNLVALRAEIGKWSGSSTRFSPRPKLPAQAVEELMRNRSRTIRDQKIAAAQGRWAKENGPTAR